MQRFTTRAFLAGGLTLALGACTPDPPPRTVSEFLDDPIGLDATLTRCNAERLRTRDDPECKNAREAAKRISAAEEQERMQRLEAESQRKLEEARRRQRELDAARARAEEQAREAEEVRILEQLQRGFSEAQGGAPPGAAPGESTESGADTSAPAGQADGGAPAADGAPPAGESGEPPLSDLDALREELNRRSGGGQDEGG